MESLLLKRVVFVSVCMIERAFIYLTSFSVTEMEALKSVEEKKCV